MTGRDKKITWKLGRQLARNMKHSGKITDPAQQAESSSEALCSPPCISFCYCCIRHRLFIFIVVKNSTMQTNQNVSILLLTDIWVVSKFYLSKAGQLHRVLYRFLNDHFCTILLFGIVGSQNIVQLWTFQRVSKENIPDYTFNSRRHCFFGLDSKQHMVFSVCVIFAILMGHGSMLGVSLHRLHGLLWNAHSGLVYFL